MQSAMNERPVYVFGAYRLDIAGRIFYAHDRPTVLAPKVFDLLAYLVENRGRVVTKEELIDAVWRGAAVSDTNIGQHILLARRALNDLTKPYRYIANAHGVGYIFTPPTDLSPATELKPSYLFDGFDLRPGSNRLLFGDEQVTLAPKAFELLYLLVTRAGTVVRRDEVVETLWPEGAVSEQHVAVLVWGLRKALSAYRPDLEFIDTVAGSGYRFARHVRAKRQAAGYDVESIAFAYHRRGRFLLTQWSLGATLAAIEQFELSLAADPEFTPSLCALSQAYVSAATASYLPSTAALERADMYAKRAIERDATLPDAHCALSEVRMFRDWDWDGALASIETARSLSPSSLRARALGVWHALLSGDFALALQQVHEHLTDEPGAYWVNALLGVVLFTGEEYAQAEEQFRDLLAVGGIPAPPLTRWYYAATLIQQGRYEEGIAQLPDLDRTPALPHTLGLASYAFARAGDKERAYAYLRRLETPAETTVVAPVYRSLAYLGLGDREKAYETLHEAYRQREATLAFAGIFPFFQPWRTGFGARALIRDLARNGNGTSNTVSP